MSFLGCLSLIKLIKVRNSNSKKKGNRRLKCQVRTYDYSSLLTDQVYYFTLNKRLKQSN